MSVCPSTADLDQGNGLVRFVLPIAEVAVVQLTMASYGHVPTLDEAKAAFAFVLIPMKCTATHVEFCLSRLSTPANLLVLLQRYIPT